MAKAKFVVDEDVELVTLRCVWHCLMCNRHFADERAFYGHFKSPGALTGCRKPVDKEGKYAILEDTDGECCQWSEVGRMYRDTPRRGVRVYGSEDW
jgi:hypothetical protein